MKINSFEVQSVPLLLRALDIITTYMFLAFGIEESNPLALYLIKIDFRLFAIVFMIFQFIGFNFMYIAYIKSNEESLIKRWFKYFYKISILICFIIPILNYSSIWRTLT